MSSHIYTATPLIGAGSVDYFPGTPYFDDNQYQPIPIGGNPFGPVSSPPFMSPLPDSPPPGSIPLGSGGPVPIAPPDPSNPTGNQANITGILTDQIRKSEAYLQQSLAQLRANQDLIAKRININSQLLSDRLIAIV